MNGQEKDLPRKPWAKPTIKVTDVAQKTESGFNVKPTVENVSYSAS